MSVFDDLLGVAGKIFGRHLQSGAFVIPNHVNDSPSGAVVVKLDAIDAAFDELGSVRVPPGFVCTECVCNVAEHLDDVLDFYFEEGATRHDLVEVFRIVCCTNDGSLGISVFVNRSANHVRIGHKELRLPLPIRLVAGWAGNYGVQLCNQGLNLIFCGHDIDDLNTKRPGNRRSVSCVLQARRAE